MKQLPVPILGLALAFSVTLLTGCIPEAVVWTPDSEAIIFTDNDSRTLVEYDLKSKTRRVVVEDTETKTPWPAISPDGKQIAVAKVEERLTQGSTTKTYQMRLKFYDRGGKLLKESSPIARTKTLENPADQTNTSLEEMAVFWSVNPDKVVTFFAIYDVPSDSWVRLDQEEIVPFFYLGDPVRPDGKGFLGMRSEDDKPFCFVTWDGKVSDFTVDDKAMDKFETRPVFLWDKDSAKLVGNNLTLDLNTASMMATEIATENGFDFLPTDGDLKGYHRFRDNDARLCVFKAKDKDDPGTSWWLELQQLESKARRTILTDKDYKDEPEDEMYPSPDGSKIALLVKTETSDRIVIVNSSGKIVGTVDRNQRAPGGN